MPRNPPAWVVEKKSQRQAENDKANTEFLAAIFKQMGAVDRDSVTIVEPLKAIIRVEGHRPIRVHGIQKPGCFISIFFEVRSRLTHHFFRAGRAYSAIEEALVAAEL